MGAAIVWLIATAEAKRKQKQGEAAYMPFVRDAARAANVPPAMLAGIVTAESSWSNLPIQPPINPISRAKWKCLNASGNPISCSEKFGTSCITSSAGAVGLTQVLPSTANMPAESLCDPANAMIAGARYLRSLYTKYSRNNPEDRAWYLAALAYNQGPGNVDGYLKSNVVAENANRLADGSITVTKKGTEYAKKVIGAADEYRSQGVAGLGAAARATFLTPLAPTARIARANMFRAIHA